MNIQNTPKYQELKFNKEDFALDFEISSDAMELSGDLETLTTVKTIITKVTCKSTCTCQCTGFCTAGCS